MSDLTEKAIKQAFVELLNEKPLSQISVRMIVERCGINRNSFYYHFPNIPDLIKEIVTETFDEIIAKYPNITSVSECFDELFEYALKNKKMILHIWKSLNREYWENNLVRFCNYAVDSYMHNVFKPLISEEDIELVRRFFTYELFGAISCWITMGMPEDSIEHIKRVLEVSQGMSEDIVKRCNKK